MKKSLGILGGLGPLASIEFVKTIYELNITDSEQKSPICFLYSDPTFPKRTECIAQGKDDILLTALSKALEHLCEINSSKIVIACITMHHFFPQLSLHLQGRIISLVDIIIQEVHQKKKKYLLFCSTGTRENEVFTKHPDWNLIEPYIIFPDFKDQHIIHNCFEQIKINKSHDFVINFINKKLDQYGVNNWISGCSELHIIHKYLMRSNLEDSLQSIIDPLLIVAQKLDYFLEQ